MGFTQGYKVNANTQFEFTVSNETLSEVVQGGGITEEDLAEYCYSALIDSRVYRIFPEMHTDSFTPGWEGTVASEYYAHMAGGPTLTTVKPAFNKDLLNDTDQAYQRNFLVWEGTIYPGTEQAKTGTFLVMDVKNLHNFYVDFNSAGFGESTVTSSNYSQTYPQYAWPGYTGRVYTYTSNTLMHHPIIMTNNNDPQLNPDHNLFVINVMVFNDQLAVAELNPSTHGNANIGSEGIAYAPFSDEWLNRGGEYFNWNDPQRHYQGVTGSWGAIGDYSGAPEYPGCPTAELSQLGFLSYVPLGNDNMLIELSGQWGQQNYANALGISYGGLTTSKSTILKWQSWCGLLYKYEDVFYKPIIQGGIIVGYSDDMDAESEYDDMINVTGNDIPSAPPRDPAQADSPWDEIKLNGAVLGGANAFCRIYYCTQAELTQLRTWTMGNSQHGDGIPAGFNPKDNLIGLMVYPFTLSGDGPANIVFTTNGGIDPITSQEMPRSLDTGVSCEGGKGDPVQILNATVKIPDTEASWGEPWLDYESHIELYIPFCGVYEVDPQAVIGRTLTIKIYLDPISGTCAGYAYASKGGGTCIVAQGSGTPGVQIPIATGNYGLAQAARVNNTLSSVTGTAQTTLSATVMQNALANKPGQAGLNGVRRITQPNSTRNSIANFNKSGMGNAALGVSGLLSGIQHWVSARQIANSCSTSASGGFSGSMAEWCGVFTPYVKIVRPKFRKPGNYKHTSAEPDVSERQLSNVTGYAVCVNPDLSGIPATEHEKAIIYQYLTTGVYVKKG